MGHLSLGKSHFQLAVEVVIAGPKMLDVGVLNQALEFQLTGLSEGVDR